MIISIEEFLSINNKLIIDMRTKEEYKAGHIIDSINFEILSYEERKKVSILYNDGLDQEAYLLAYEYALDKLPKLFSIIKKNKEKPIVFYCARGGSRSSIVYEVFKNLKDVDIYKIKNGYKSYRQFSNSFFSTKLVEYKTIILYDNMDIELPNQIFNSSDYLLVDLRNKVEPEKNPFRLLINKRKYLNSRILNYWIFEKLYNYKFRKIVFILPVMDKNNEALQEGLSELIHSSPKVYIEDILEDQVKYIKANYLEDEYTLDLIIDFLESKRKEMSNTRVDNIIDALKSNSFDKGIKLILLSYYEPLMDYYISKNNILRLNSIKEIRNILESWSEKNENLY